MGGALLLCVTLSACGNIKEGIVGVGKGVGRVANWLHPDQPPLPISVDIPQELAQMPRAMLKLGDSSEYEGTVDADGLRHGYGMQVWPDGARYQGAFEHGERTGNGVFVWPSGSRFEGGFLNGKRHGPGVFVWPNGSRYVGEYVNGKRHGQGSFYPAGETVVVCQEAPREETQTWNRGQLVARAPAATQRNAIDPEQMGQADAMGSAWSQRELTLPPPRLR
ncbi:hypothetical protein MAIT1_05318 [Magnetofaba australis IT-1]|uniref:MORN repeat-containing protein n=1 Tax=Magnetofaba australis IT-1 TaxID=1434232 RepID=A0A1Y2K0G9_9PROT|nr:hypothetical protein MAIT1_05318 [Magnetofaba australis IT-1]